MPAVTEFELWWETYSPQGIDHWHGYDQAKAAWDEGCNAGAGHKRERASKAKESAPSAPTNTGSPKCEQCEHFDISQGVYTIECYSCNRYCGDLFTLRAGA